MIIELFIFREFINLDFYDTHSYCIQLLCLGGIRYSKLLC